MEIYPFLVQRTSSWIYFMIEVLLFCKSFLPNFYRQFCLMKALFPSSDWKPKAIRKLCYASVLNLIRQPECRRGRTKCRLKKANQGTPSSFLLSDSKLAIFYWYTSQTTRLEFCSFTKTKSKYIGGMLKKVNQSTSTKLLLWI